LESNYQLPLTDLIIRDTLLSTALEPEIISHITFGMLGGAACHALAPHLEGRG